MRNVGVAYKVNINIFEDLRFQKFSVCAEEVLLFWRSFLLHSTEYHHSERLCSFAKFSMPGKTGMAWRECLHLRFSESGKCEKLLEWS